MSAPEINNPLGLEDRKAENLLTIKACVLQKVRMDCGFALEINIIWDPTSALVCKIVLVRGPVSSVHGRVIQLTYSHETSNQKVGQCRGVGRGLAPRLSRMEVLRPVEADRY